MTANELRRKLRTLCEQHTNAATPIDASLIADRIVVLYEELDRLLDKPLVVTDPVLAYSFEQGDNGPVLNLEAVGATGGTVEIEYTHPNLFKDALDALVVPDAVYATGFEQGVETLRAQADTVARAMNLPATPNDISGLE